ncbi:D-serine ammonia-lyase [Bacillus sp. M6-12]|uniref:D-serine ammonia-lyase n=1 Tax=Bacillus sp. M6-12 TaxID=2054166 RepID=UPI000C7745CD|nr:D-serine ammonia-lyase [Bacillus sp. M6-12]PLS17911.1 D-serine ammonia-lyase [Bacillus sp. M6-12]
MTIKSFQEKTIEQWKKEYPVLKAVADANEVFWANPDYGENVGASPLKAENIADAAERLQRFAPYIAKVFPETAETNGIIESPLISIPNMQNHLENKYEVKIEGSMLLKCDSHLPISGSIKARGGIYEVLKHAEGLAVQAGMLSYSDDYTILDSEKFKSFFSEYSIAVGSTGNLGLSIGIMSAQLGFKVSVHMSADAKKWKKDLLCEKGVMVIEYQSDYSKAVEEGRRQAGEDPNCHFIDDEKSCDLFLGYAVAASRLKKQLDKQGIAVDKDHPLFVYLPCGVGGGPGGITFGLKEEFGEYVHCFFAEPTHSPCFLIGQATGLHDQISVQDFGLDNRTDADGLAVGRASGFVGKTIGHMLSGCYTVEDGRLYSLLREAADTENIFLEPSAVAGFYGPVQLCGQPAGQEYLQKQNLQQSVKNGTHIIWATGGSMVPKDIMEEYYQKG